jgi:hypothetical protein
MAAQLKAPKAPVHARPEVFTHHPDSTAPESLARLSAVHAEAQETALLANLLGRTLFAGLVLATATAIAVVEAHASLVREISWGLLMLIGVGALIWAYLTTIGSPFAISALRVFGADLSGILFYAGFAWGAGAFLILPFDSGPVAAVLFSACMAVVVASILREPEPVVIFVVPVALLTGLAAFLRPFPTAELTASLAVTSCGFVTGAVLISEWIARRTHRAPQPVDGLPA